MKRVAFLTTLLAAVLVVLLPFIGGGGPSIGTASAALPETGTPVFASATLPKTATDAAPAAVGTERSVASQQAATAKVLAVDTEHLAQKPVPIPPPPAPPAAPSSGKRGGAASAGVSPGERRAVKAAAGQSCAPSPGGGGGAPGGGDGQGATGTTSGDIQSFSSTYNAIRAANCLDPIPAGNFRYDACMEQRLYWMAEDPSANPGNTWGHAGVRSLTPAADGSYYSDTTPSRGCDGNLAGGSGNSGATVAQKWWDSSAHRLALYKPSFTGGTGGVCIFFAMTHGGVGDSGGFTRAAARWGSC
ncbi:hypothetical protein [Lacisediminihabitans changchengi]|uniref:Uncharacterized protein n=1 Tax=Lacisediminihabitans changchengi TaxID=2787634 RepID=A0A934STR8_9MICO|nr:hypothetical protein [Lacisediminihabitans changchengi]MBK4348833.1 hypothetical protein [Lacisediminihabitans changchengi]